MRRGGPLACTWTASRLVKGTGSRVSSLRPPHASTLRAAQPSKAVLPAPLAKQLSGQAVKQRQQTLEWSEILICYYIILESGITDISKTITSSSNGLRHSTTTSVLCQSPILLLQTFPCPTTPAGGCDNTRIFIVTLNDKPTCPVCRSLYVLLTILG